MGKSIIRSLSGIAIKDVHFILQRNNEWAVEEKYKGRIIKAVSSDYLILGSGEDEYCRIFRVLGNELEPENTTDMIILSCFVLLD